MTDFFSLSDGTSAANTTGSAELSTDILPIAENTNVMAVCDQAKWDEYDNTEYISLRWSILKPGEYENRKIFQKVKVFDEKSADKHKKMLAAIDMNAGGKLVALGRAPTDEDLEVALTNRIMTLKLGEWEINGKQGNWVKAVSPKDSAPTPSATPKTDNDIPL